MKVDAFSPCSAVQIQYVSIALTCFGSGLAAPAQQELLGDGRALRDDVVGRGLAAVGDGGGARDDPHHQRRQAAEVLAACSSEISFSLPSFHSPASRAVSAWRSAGALPVSSWLVRLGVGHRRLEVVVDEQPPDVLVREAADELLDVDPAIAERPPSRSGSAISVSTATTPSRPGLKSFIAVESIEVGYA